MPKRTQQTALPGMDDTWDDGEIEPLDAADEQSVETPYCESSPSPPPESLEGSPVYVIDANSLIFQVFHAIPEMTSPGGEPVNAVYGFTRDVLHLLEDRKPDY